MYTLYGKKGSGSASTQAALEIIGAPYPPRRDGLVGAPTRRSRSC